MQRAPNRFDSDLRLWSLHEGCLGRESQVVAGWEGWEGGRGGGAPCLLSPSTMRRRTADSAGAECGCRSAIYSRFGGVVGDWGGEGLVWLVVGCRADSLALLGFCAFGGRRISRGSRSFRRIQLVYVSRPSSDLSGGTAS